MVAHYLRQLGLRRTKISFFLHIPFPSYDLFRRLPWNGELIYAMMEYDLLGFQTKRDRRNFLRCVKEFMPEVAILAHKSRFTDVQYGSRRVRIGYYPISIDYKDFNDRAHDPEVTKVSYDIHRKLSNRRLMLGLDRLDYTKGIPQRFRAFERALEKYPKLHGNLSMIQVLIPSRTRLPDYIDLKSQLDELAGRINGRFSKHEWLPIFYMFHSLKPAELLGHYRACEIALITPLRDGMNLVAKEYCASSIDNNGVLILSEFAGAADQLSKGALIVNPYDVEGTADAIYEAFKMPIAETSRRMRVMRTEIKRNDVHQWAAQYLSTFL